MFAVAIVFAVCDANTPGSITPRSAITCRRLSPPPKARRRDCPSVCCQRQGQPKPDQSCTTLRRGARQPESPESVLLRLTGLVRLSCSGPAIANRSCSRRKSDCHSGPSPWAPRPVLPLTLSFHPPTETALGPERPRNGRLCQRRSLLPTCPPTSSSRLRSSDCFFDGPTAASLPRTPLLLGQQLSFPPRFRHAHAETDRERHTRQSPRTPSIRVLHPRPGTCPSCRDTTARAVVASLHSRPVPPVAHAQENRYPRIDHSMKSRLV